MNQSRGVLAVTAALSLAVATIVTLVLAVAVLGSAANGSTTCPATGETATQPPRSAAAATIPANYLAIYQKAGRDYGIGWNVLAAVGEVESDHGRGTSPGIRSGANYAGAKGPMQFLQATWDAYSVDGNRDGTKNVYDPADAIPGAANYLTRSGAPGNLRRALYAYNHAGWYVDKVLKAASKYAAGGFTTTRPNTAGTDCTNPDAPIIAGAFGQRVVAHAREWIGTPYSWGGGRVTGPSLGSGRGAGTVGFDCSGLTLYAVYHASGKKISIDHYTGDQWNDKRGRRITDFAQLQVGDLMFFGSDLHHVAIFSGAGKMVEAPYTGARVREVTARRNDFAGAVRFGEGMP